MKVTRVGTGKNPDKAMQKYSMADQYLLTCIQGLVYFFGLAPYKYNKETWEISFRWFSSTTIWTLIRLIIFNAPFSFLPIMRTVRLKMQQAIQQHQCRLYIGLFILSSMSLAIPSLYCKALQKRTLLMCIALRGLGLLLADGALTVEWGKTFWRVGRFFFLRKRP